jgi:hypothetical protein
MGSTTSWEAVACLERGHELETVSGEGGASLTRRVMKPMLLMRRLTLTDPPSTWNDPDDPVLGNVDYRQAMAGWKEE